LRVHPFRTADGRIDGATMVAVDIDLIRRSHELIEARDNALAIVQAVPEPMVVLDAACVMVSANDAFYMLIGEAPGKAEGRRPWEVADVAWLGDSLRHALQDACAGKDPLVDLEIEAAVPRRGQRLLVLNRRRILRVDRPSLVLLAIEDVTDARQAEALRIDAESLRLVDGRKDEFLGILAHELRNPLAPMRFALELLRRSDGKQADTSRARQVLERQINHLVRIVDDLLDVSRITQGKVELRKERVELATLVNAAVEFCRPVMEAAGHALTISLPGETVTLDGDAVRLTQVLVNLLNNAVKFTPPGGHIWIIADTLGEVADAHDQLRIRVRDAGIGIAPQMLPKIFDMFTQGDLSLERTRGGLGVGLTLVRNLVGLHGGTVDVRNDGLGSGSEFTVRLPIDPPAQLTGDAHAAPSENAAARPRRILVADDHADGRDMLGYWLTEEGHTVALAADGPSALTTAAEFGPDVAILDIGMPGMNGYTVAEAIRNRFQGSSVVLVALSGLGQREDRERARRASFDRHFTKSVDVNALRSFLAGLDPAQGNA
jgi:PAS domain S-box-containing protein